MKITSDDLKRAFKSHIRRCVPSSREACPSAESIFGLFGDSLSLSDKEKVMDHVTGCSFCLQEFELYLDFHRREEMAVRDLTCRFGQPRRIRAMAGRKAESTRIPLSPILRSLYRWRWAAASLSVTVLLIAVLFGIRSIIRAPGVGERGRLPGQVHLIFPVRGQAVKMPLIFRWEEIPRAEYYDLEIFDKSLLPLWKSSHIETPQYKFPSESAGIMQVDEVYFWTVTAWVTDGTKRESLLEEFIKRE